MYRKTIITGTRSINISGVTWITESLPEVFHTVPRISNVACINRRDYRPFDRGKCNPSYMNLFSVIIPELSLELHYISDSPDEGERNGYTRCTHNSP